MKKYLSIIILGLSISSIRAQDASDAIRYAQDNLNGTARFRAMGGAFGALGGDFSSINVNPAGSAVFNNNQASLTLSSINTSNKSDYFGTKTKENDNTFDLNQVGIVWVFNDRSGKSDWKKFSLAVNYENANLFDNSIYSAGYNPTNSIANYFTSYANGIPSTVITNNNYEYLNYSEQQAYLGYEGYIINPVAGSANNEYVSNLSGTGNYYQENSISSTGYNGKVSFNAAASYKDRLYIGLNLNSHFTDFTKHTSFYEDYIDSPGHNESAGVQALRFSNDLNTYGTGFSFQVGAIGKVTEAFRIGLSYESPTWYRLNDELVQTLSVRTVEQGSFFADPDLRIIYPTYKLQTPGKYTGSLAYVFGKNGLISFDYILKDYSNTTFKPQSDYTGLNNQMEAIFDKTSEYRIGAEYKIKQWSIRGGYRFEQSPYKDGKTIGDLNSYSTGIGYSFGDTKIDLAYTLAKRDYQQGFFSQGLTDAATINTRNDNISLTLLFEL